MSLIEKARNNLAEQEQTKALFQQMRQDAIALLDTHGQRIKRLDDRIMIAIASPVLCPLYLYLALFKKVTPFEFADERELTSSLSHDERPIRITLSSQMAVPSKSRYVTIEVTGLEESLVLYKNSAAIHRPRLFQRRTPNLEDANKWNEVFELLKEKHPIPPTSSV